MNKLVSSDKKNERKRKNQGVNNRSSSVLIAYYRIIEAAVHVESMNKKTIDFVLVRAINYLNFIRYNRVNIFRQDIIVQHAILLLFYAGLAAVAHLLLCLN